MKEESKLEDEFKGGGVTDWKHR